MMELNRVAWLVSALLATQALAAPDPRAATRVVNVTADSAPGWTPSVELEKQAAQTASDFLAASDAGDAERSFALLTPVMQRESPLPAFSAELRRFNAEAGAPLERRLTALTWTKDPANAPAPGIYAAFDLISRFANIGRHCGYLVLYEPPGSQDFRVTRIENNYITDANFNAVGGEATWTKLSANCPNFGMTQAAVEPLPETTDAAGDHLTVAATLAAVKAQAGVTLRMQNGWTIVDDKTHATFWSFPPLGNPAYPSAVRRTVVEKDGAVTLKMDVQCEATKTACDNLVRDFQAINARVASGSAAAPR